MEVINPTINSEADILQFTDKLAQLDPISEEYTST